MIPDWVYALYINATNAYRVFYGEKKGGLIWIRRKDRHWFVSKDGIGLYSPTARCLGANMTVFQRRFESVFKVEKGDGVMDVGACIGDTAVPFAMKCGKEGFVVAIEPEPRNADCLRLNLAPFPSCVIERAAWMRTERLRFSVNPSVMGHSLREQPNETGFMEVQADTIDNMAKQARRTIDFLKIDVQGAELQALEGASDVLKHVGKVVVETHLINGESTCPGVVAFFEDRGFKVRTTPQVGRNKAPDIVHAWMD